MAKSGFSAWLERQIEERDWTITEAAKRIGIAQSNLSRYINGSAVPGRKNLRTLVTAFGVDRDDLEAMIETDRSQDLLANSRTKGVTPFQSTDIRGTESVAGLVKKLQSPDFVILALRADGTSAEPISEHDRMAAAEALLKFWCEADQEA